MTSNDHQPVFASEIDLRRTNTAGLPIPQPARPSLPLPVRPEFLAPMSMSEVRVDLYDRGRPLTREEVDNELNDHMAAIRAKRMSPMLEIAWQLREELRALEIIHQGTWDERLETVAAELVASDNDLIVLAGKYIEIALIHLKSKSE